VDCQEIAKDGAFAKVGWSPERSTWTRSPGCAIHRASLRDDLFPKVATQVPDGPEIDLAPDHVTEVELELSDGEQAWRAAELKLDEQVDVTVWLERPMDGRAEEPQASNAVSRAERAKSHVVDGDSLGQVHGRSLAGRR